jgi:hypothetical protein
MNMSTISCRYDFSPIEKYELTPEGYLRAWASIARTGIQHYTDSDGSIRREYRPETEVASPDSLASFAGKAITSEHPPVLLDSENTKDYQVGFSGTEVVYDNGFVKAVMTITDEDTIKRIMKGDAREVSAGYRVNYDPTPGVTENGEHYDGVQKEIIGHLDRQDAADPSLISNGGDHLMTAKVNFDGAEFEVTESVALAITKEREDAKMSFEDMKKKYDELQAAADSMKSEMDAMEKEMKGKCDSAEGRADALAEQIEELKAELATAQEINLDSMVEERVALIEKAKPVLDSAYAFAGKTAREVMVDSIKAVRGDELDLSEKSDDYVQAMFDTLSEGRSDSATTDELRKAVASIASPVSAPSAYMDMLQNAWKKPLSISKEAK